MLSNNKWKIVNCISIEKRFMKCINHVIQGHTSLIFLNKLKTTLSGLINDLDTNQW